MAFSPIPVAAEIDCWRDYSKMEFRHLLAMTENELSTVDPLVLPNRRRVSGRRCHSEECSSVRFRFAGIVET